VTQVTWFSTDREAIALDAPALYIDDRAARLRVDGSI
jgi:hypothetical protein